MDKVSLFTHGIAALAYSSRSRRQTFHSSTKKSHFLYLLRKFLFRTVKIEFQFFLSFKMVYHFVVNK
jgi:hypothetical protein